MIPAEWNDLTDDGKLHAIYQKLTNNEVLLMALQDQIQALTIEATTLRGAVADLAAAVDAEQAQVAAAIALLSADSPDVAAVIATLQEGQAAIAAVKADVESTIPDAPPPPTA